MTAAVSVVICAYTEDRWVELVDAVRSVRLQRPDEVLLVIDHNPALAGRARAALREIRVLDNTRTPGLSGARNTGIAAARGDVIAFLDDDAAAAPGWLDRLTAPFASAEVIAVGGAADPVWPAGGRPASLPRGRELDWVIGCSYRGQPEALAEIRNVMGCNMAFRRTVFDRIGGFAEEIGRVGASALGCEETELCIRARQRMPGARILFEPAAVVNHQVSADRVTWRYLVRRCWAEGVSKAVVARMIGSTDALSTERGYVLRVLPSAVLRELGQLLRGRWVALARAAAVPVALTCTATGYLWARSARR